MEDFVKRYQDNIVSFRLDYEKHLAGKGVSFPADSQLPGLVYLYCKLGTPVSQSELTDCYLALGKEYNKQLRHAAADGWYLKSGNTRATRLEFDGTMSRDELCLASITEANPLFLQNKQTRQNFLSSANWGEILTTFSERGCAVCGRKYATYDRGHLDFSKPLEIGNIVPMCSECNNYAAAHHIVYRLSSNCGLVARPVRMKDMS